MLNRLQRSIQRWAHGRTLLTLLLILGALWTMLDIAHVPFGLPALTTHSGGLQILDLRIGYTPDEAYTLLEALGPEGRRAYTTMLLAGDILFPVTYSLFFATVAAWLLRRVLPPDHSAQRLSLLAFVGGAADLAENACILAMLQAFPRRLDGVAWLSSLLKIPKFGSAVVGMALLVVFAVILIWRRAVDRRMTLRSNRP